MSERSDLLTLRDIHRLGFSHAVIDMTDADAAARCRKKGFLDVWNYLTPAGVEAIAALEREKEHSP